MAPLKRMLFGLLLALSANLLSLFPWLGLELGLDLSRKTQLTLFVLLLICFIGINLYPKRNNMPSKSIYILASGSELLQLFLISVILTTVIQISLGVWYVPMMRPPSAAIGSDVLFKRWGFGLLYAIVAESIVFWNGMLRVYLTSIQLGIKHRVLALLCGWILGVNIYYLRKIIGIATEEIETETKKWELDVARAESEVCKTKYPFLLVHGVFFRDFRYLNYWGRIPRELQKNGATIYYGEQQSADTVEDCGEELANRIRKIVRESGCEKVNIIAHSKGGLDSRAAISHFGAAPYVASLTTINTPHRGCLFAEYLLKTMPETVCQTIADTYNTTLKQLGDPAPDFLGAVTDLTESSCLARNEVTPDAPEVLYESVMSYCKKAQGGRFPLNLSYQFVKHFDGKNDGLVSITSAQWGSRFTLLEPRGRRGISHGDMVDLNRENIPGFDVREFYVSLVADLKQRGY